MIFSPQRPLRVAIVGAGPAGFYSAGALFKLSIPVQVDMFEKLPAPFGLVRYGVAPDHQKIKEVIKVFEKTAGNPAFSYFGNVEVGRDIKVDQLRSFYDAVIFTYGTEADKRLGIPGENFKSSHTATEFVGWYNGHPTFQERQFDFSHEVAVVMGQGNVAMDVARILCQTPDELKKTDIFQGALEALAQSKIKEVYLFGRRGPLQASFTPEEIKEMGELQDCYPVIDPRDLELNESSHIELSDPMDPRGKKKYEIMKSFISKESKGKQKKFILRFYRTPVAILGLGKVSKIRFEINKLVGRPHEQKVEGTGQFEEISCGLFLCSIGYAGLPIEGLPFSSQRGIVPNERGRVLTGERIVPGFYAAGWIKRGPSGIIGVNKHDAEETIASLIEDLDSLTPCENPNSDAVKKLLDDRGVRSVNFIDWKKIDLAEIARGLYLSKPREKFITIHDMLGVIDNRANDE
ncbi:MAG: NADP oxidoreductase [Candidatus Omnitrophica bacterium]|nr:NADP oxidoreductase [Candidatus Omnitrophota bacterium]